MRHYLRTGVPAAQAAALVREGRTAAPGSNPGVPSGDVRKALEILHRSLERFDDGPADRALGRLLGVFAPGVVLRDVVLPFLRELGERWARGEVGVAEEHFASGYLEGWMLSLGRGAGQAGRRRAVLACVPGERHTLGLIAFGVALRDLGWRVTYLGADTPLPALDRAARATGAEVIVLAAAMATTFGAAAAAVEDLAGRRPVRIGGAGAADARLGWVAERLLPADPVAAAQALSLNPPTDGGCLVVERRARREFRRTSRVSPSGSRNS